MSLQSMEALLEGQRIRLDRAVVKREINRRKRLIHEILINPPSCMLGITVVDLLTAQYGWGLHRATTFLSRWPNPTQLRQLRSLTDRERRLLSEELKKPNSV